MESAYGKERNSNTTGQRDGVTLQVLRSGLGAKPSVFRCGGLRLWLSSATNNSHNHRGNDQAQRQDQHTWGWLTDQQPTQEKAS